MASISPCAAAAPCRWITSRYRSTSMDKSARRSASCRARSSSVSNRRRFHRPVSASRSPGSSAAAPGDGCAGTPAAGLVSGPPTAPITSGVHPCFPAAPCGADDASISRLSMPGLISALSCATKLPMENPSMSTRPNSMAVRNAIASCAIWVTVLGVVPVEPPTPTLSNVTTRRPADKSVDQGRIPVVEVPAEVLQQNQRDRALTLLAVGVVDPIRSLDRLVRNTRVRRHQNHLAAWMPCSWLIACSPGRVARSRRSPRW